MSADSATTLGTRGGAVALRAARAAPVAAGERSAAVFAHGSLLVRFYQPDSEDRQTPHDRDELYVVADGRGEFVCDGHRTSFGPGDLLFAAAGAEHRFERFSEDFATWVVFYGPLGGEPAQPDRSAEHPQRHGPRESSPASP